VTPSRVALYLLAGESVRVFLDDLLPRCVRVAHRSQNRESESLASRSVPGGVCVELATLLLLREIHIELSALSENLELQVVEVELPEGMLPDFDAQLTGNIPEKHALLVDLDVSAHSGTVLAGGEIERVVEFCHDSVVS
jgi:hypothetical protein